MSGSNLPTLYEAVDAYGAALEAVDAATTPEDVQTALALLEQVQDTLALKSERVAGLMREFELRAGARKAEADRLAELARLDASRAEHIRAYLLRELQAANLPSGRLETLRFRLSVRNNPPALEVTDPSQVPAAFKTTTLVETVDKQALKAHIKATGEVVPGARITQSVRLHIA